MKKKYIFLFISIISISLIVIYIKNHLKNEMVINKNTPITQVTADQSVHKNEIKPEAKKEEAPVINTMEDKENTPNNLQLAEEEKTYLEKKLDLENAVERLNSNSLSKEEREQYSKIYKRISILKSYIINSKLNSVSDKLKDIEAHHKERLQQYGVSDTK
ncbi:hypothetical protein [Fluviispira multicolorata]|uniref:Uncharacterized protein n=1 Tax=Fluviispira multicolorata TaxID=2654512 RepID=A0A833JDW7_9BACT|nr:hypothetical protein [Fluviispira multicolorata]KAB8032105.1 hypothetical protein GCL57_05515 [Fluviispira multicolorata]